MDALIDRWPLRGDHPIALTVVAEPILNIRKTGTSQAVPSTLRGEMGNRQSGMTAPTLFAVLPF
jgi:hypothetical protein